MSPRAYIFWNPDSTAATELLTSLDAAQAANDSISELLKFLVMAMTPRAGNFAIGDFAAGLFRTLGYAIRNRIARTGKVLSIFICGEFKLAQTDACIVDREQNDILLLVQEDKRFEEGEGAHPEAIATSAVNNEERIKADMEPLDEKISLGTFFPVVHR